MLLRLRLGPYNGSNGWKPDRLAAQSELCNQLQIAVVLGARKIVQQSSSAANHFQQTATRVIVMLICSQMLGQGIDAMGQQSDLDIGRAGVTCMQPMLLNNSGSIGLSKGHSLFLSLSPLSQ